MVMNPSSVTVPDTAGPPSPKPSMFTIFDIVGFAFGAWGLFCSSVFVLAVKPVFVKMFADYRVPLPGFTELCLTPWFPFAIGLIPFVVVGTGVIRRAKLRTRAVLMACALLFTIVILPGVLLLGSYLPIFSIAPAH